MNVLDSTCLKWGMTISAEKTKVLPVGGPSVNSLPFMLQGQPPEEVDSLSYHGSVSSCSSRVESEVDARMEKAGKVYQVWRHRVFRSRNLRKSTKVKVLHTMVMSVLCMVLKCGQ